MLPVIIKFVKYVEVCTVASFACMHVQFWYWTLCLYTKYTAVMTGSWDMAIEVRHIVYGQWLFLTDPSTRGKLTLPPRAQVDYRAACFCHRTLIDVGYVCSVCLSGELYLPFKSLKNICYINALNVCCSKSTSYVAKWLYAVIWVCFFLGLWSWSGSL